MNSQVNYIISASLFLAVCAGVGFLIKKVPVVITEQGYTYGCGTVDPSPNNELSGNALKGKIIFMGKCASCHVLFKNMTGPGLLGFTERGPWTNRKNIYEWIRNPAAFMSKNEYTKQLKEMYNGTMMTAFPDMTNDEIDAICDYIGQSGKNYE